MAQTGTNIIPEIVVDTAGKITWTPVLSEHDPLKFYRGKTLTNTEFNDLFLKHTYQSNYTAKTLALF